MSYSVAGAENLRRMDAELSSIAMLAALERLQQPADHIPAPIPFERQLELVSQGKARVIPVIPIRRPDPDFTIGGIPSALFG